MKESREPTADRRPYLLRLKVRILHYLADGTSPEKLALAMAIGAACGLFPVYGLTTAVSAVVGIAFRANPVVVQVLNYMMYPIYFPIEFGFILAGAWLFEGGLHAYTMSGIKAIFIEGGLAGAFRQIGTALVHAVLVWLIVAPFIGLGLRLLLVSMIKRWRAEGRRP